MRKSTITLFIFLLFVSICYAQQIQIPISSPSNPTTIEVYNIRGQRILSREFTHYTRASFSLSNNLATQIYIMRVRNGNNVITRKFMPNHRIQFVGNFSNARNVSPNETVRQREVEYQNLLQVDPFGDSVTNIIFINGMNNTRAMAYDNLQHIQLAYEDRLRLLFPGDYIFTLGYNHTHGVVRDFAEVMHQWSREFSQPLNALEWLAPIIEEEYYEEAMGLPTNSRNSTNNVSNPNLRRGFLYRIVELILKFGAENIVQRHSLTTDGLKGIMDDSFQNFQRVIVIAHSQGNLFANELINHYRQNDKEREMRSTGVLNIAPPSVSPSKSWWFTNNDDKIINDARAFFSPDILPGSENYIISKDVEDPRERRRHGFWTSYFHHNLQSRVLIDSVFFDYCRELPFYLMTYHPDDVAQINNLIKNHGLDWEYDNPESWGGEGDYRYISWTNAETNKRITRFDIYEGGNMYGDITLDLPMLDSLTISGNPISSLSISKSTRLRFLRVSWNQLSSIDLSNNPELRHLILHNNQLPSLDLSKNTALTEFVGYNNQLTSLDLSKNTELRFIYVPANQLRSLNLPNSATLTELYAYANQLTSLDLSKNTGLRDLSISGNQLTSLDLSNNPALTELNVSYNQLTSLDLSNNKDITSLHLNDNQLTSLNLSNSIALQEIMVHYNQLTSLDLSNSTALTFIEARNNQLTFLNVTNSTELTQLSASGNQLTSLNVSNNTRLVTLSVSGNRLDSLDLSNNTALTRLWLDYNQITSLNLSNNTALTELRLDYNQMESLILPNNVRLPNFNCRGNDLPEELCP